MTGKGWMSEWMNELNRKVNSSSTELVHMVKSSILVSDSIKADIDRETDR